MAKRIYTPKAISPEIARENAISAARARIHNDRTYLDLCLGALASLIKHGTAEEIAAATDAVEMTLHDVERSEAALRDLLTVSQEAV